MRRLKEYKKFLLSLMKTNMRLLYGMWKLTRLPQPAITFFGGARVPLESSTAEQAKTLAGKLVNLGFSIITGGGPGIMEAANFGAIEYLRDCDLNSPHCKQGIVSAGIGLIKLNKERINPYVQQNIVMNYFFARKWLLVRYAVGFVIFPGGFGTLDEFFEVITLIQCNRMPEVPVILLGTQYWAPIRSWVFNNAIKEGLIDHKDADLFIVTDSIDEAAELLKKKCLGCQESVIADEAEPK